MPVECYLSFNYHSVRVCFYFRETDFSFALADLSEYFEANRPNKRLPFIIIIIIGPRARLYISEKKKISKIFFSVPETDPIGSTVKWDKTAKC